MDNLHKEIYTDEYLIKCHPYYKYYAQILSVEELCKVRFTARETANNVSSYKTDRRDFDVVWVNCVNSFVAETLTAKLLGTSPEFYGYHSNRDYDLSYNGHKYEVKFIKPDKLNKKWLPINAVYGEIVANWDYMHIWSFDPIKKQPFLFGWIHRDSYLKNARFSEDPMRDRASRQVIINRDYIQRSVWINPKTNVEGKPKTYDIAYSNYGTIFEAIDNEHNRYVFLRMNDHYYHVVKQSYATDKATVRLMSIQEILDFFGFKVSMFISNKDEHPLMDVIQVTRKKLSVEPTASSNVYEEEILLDVMLNSTAPPEFQD